MHAMKEKEINVDLMFPPESGESEKNTYAKISPTSIHNLELEYLA